MFDETMSFNHLSQMGQRGYDIFLKVVGFTWGFHQMVVSSTVHDYWHTRAFLHQVHGLSSKTAFFRGRIGTQFWCVKYFDATTFTMFNWHLNYMPSWNITKWRSDWCPKFWWRCRQVWRWTWPSMTPSSSRLQGDRLSEVGWAIWLVASDVCHEAQVVFFWMSTLRVYIVQFTEFIDSFL